jgi:predicted nucleic acid-binding protein
MLLAAIDLQENNSLSFWDAPIVQTASAARCSALYTEDMHMQAGARIAAVLIVNPFT